MTRDLNSSTLRLGFAAAVCILTAGIAISQALAQSANPPFSVPTTKLLAIGSFTAGATPKAWMPLIPLEARETAELYFGGKIDQWYLKQDQSGVVFILNLTDPNDAHALLDNLPLGQAGLMKFDIIPLGPLAPLRAAMTSLPK